MFRVCCFSQEYKLLFEGAGSNPGDKTLEDRFFEHEVSMNMTEREQDRGMETVRLVSLERKSGRTKGSITT